MKFRVVAVSLMSQRVVVFFLLNECFRSLSLTYIDHTQLVGLLRTSEQLVGMAASYTTQNKLKRRTSLSGIRIRDPSNQRPQDLTANGIVMCCVSKPGQINNCVERIA